MRTEGFFGSLGQILGSAIRFVLDLVSGGLNGIWQAIDEFFQGLARALGMNASIFGFIVLALGLMMLYSGIRAFWNRAFIKGIIWLVLGLTLMSWLIY